MMNDNKNNEFTSRVLNPVEASIAAYNMNMIDDIGGRGCSSSSYVNPEMTQRPLDPVEASIAAYNMNMIDDIRRHGSNSIYGRAADLSVIYSFAIFGACIAVSRISDELIKPTAYFMVGVILFFNIRKIIKKIRKNRK